MLPVSNPNTPYKSASLPRSERPTLVAIKPLKNNLGWYSYEGLSTQQARGATIFATGTAFLAGLVATLLSARPNTSTSRVFLNTLGAFGASVLAYAAAPWASKKLERWVAPLPQEAKTATR